LLESEVPDFRRYDPVHIVSQFRRSLNRELDLAKEARNIDQFARHFADDPLVKIPRVYWEFTNDRVNVQEEIVGKAGVSPDKLRESGLDPKLLAARGADTVLRMVLVHGYFHADPHPGNVLFLPDNRIGIIDFGMVGMLTHHRRNQIVDLLHALTLKDEQALLQVLLEWSGDAVVDEDRLAYDVTELLQSYDDLQLKDVKIGGLLNDITALMRDNTVVARRPDPAVQDADHAGRTGAAARPRVPHDRSCDAIRGKHHPAALYPGCTVCTRAQERARGAGSGGRLAA
jgi:ubiquinone biosynthesis protein